jgi:DedD protein
VVQVGGFADEKNAQQLRDRLVQAGFSAFIDSSQPGGKIPHKVKVGPEPDRARAQALRDRLFSQEHIQGFVTAQP